MLTNRLLIVAVILPFISSCQVLSLTLQEGGGGLDSKAKFFEELEHRVPGRFVVYEQITTIVDDGTMLLAERKSDCKPFKLPASHEPPQTPEFEPWETNDPDIINSKLIKHIEALHDYIDSRNDTIDDRYRNYVDGCPDLRIKTEAKPE